MAIDPSIILGLKGPAPVAAPTSGPLEDYSKGLTLRALIGQNQLQQLQVQQAQQTLDEDARYRKIVGEHFGAAGTPPAGAVAATGVQPGTAPSPTMPMQPSPNGIPVAPDMPAAPTAAPASATLDALIPKLQAAGLQKQAQALQTQVDTHNEKTATTGKNIAETGKIRTEVEIKGLQHTASALADVAKMPPGRQQQGYETALAIAEKLVPGSAANLRKIMPVYDAAQAGQLVSAGLTHAEQLKAELEARQAVETNRHNVASEGLTARGQNMVDARSKENNLIQQEAGRTQVEKDENGNFFLIDKGKGTIKTPLNPDTGKPMSGAQKPITESQGKAGTYATRASSASAILDSVGKDGEVQPGLIKRAAEAVPLAGNALGTLTNFTQSPKQQQVEQAQRDFLNAVLRLESGAAISPSEFDSGRKQYFPQPGDSKEVIAQKKANRETEISGLKTMAGPAGKSIKAPVATIKGDDGYNALPSGAEFIAPDGSRRIKP